MAKADPSDLYMNFADISVDLDAANSASLVEGQFKTGLSVRGQLAWIVHSIEVYFADAAVATSIQELAVCTVGELATMPDLGDKGVIHKCRERLLYAGAAFAAAVYRPYGKEFLPPVPLASPNLSVYAKTAADDANLRGETIEVRLGFTTVPMDSKLVLEIAETWGY